MYFGYVYELEGVGGGTTVKKTLVAVFSVYATDKTARDFITLCSLRIIDISLYIYWMMKEKNSKGRKIQFTAVRSGQTNSAPNPSRAARPRFSSLVSWWGLCGPIVTPYLSMILNTY